MARQTVGVKVDIDGLADMRLAIKRMQVSDKLAARRATYEVAQRRALNIIMARKDRQGEAAGSTTRAARGRWGEVRIGGSRRVTHRGTPAGVLVMGAEFGGVRWRQFGAPSPKGRWIFPTLARYSHQTFKEMDRAVSEALGKDWRGGPHR